MDANSNYELYLIKKELNNIINELDSISRGMNSNFKGIGNQRCASCISNVANKYRWVKKKLDNIDTSKVTEAYASAHGGGGSAGGGGSSRSF